ncbi:M23 family metallopeptidase [Aquibium sp. A9E412]|uniref:M23 family metallopeptidase n=1 Tax=Aquibium sp. A9E412 TaxID=2976767 RepID=UPI0025AEE24C|nr:M23 family metallopeptidase [Aquibium sp. A9E412]MDN2567745.1 M23 family metallopeptidase [Aquibium sp. A9E412]
MRLAAIVGLLVALAAAVAPAAAEPEAVATGRALTEAFWQGRTGRLWARMNAPMREALGSEQAFGSFRDGAAAELGAEEAVLSERATEEAGLAIYRRTSRFSGVARPVETQWALDGEGRIAGFFIRPVQSAAPSRFLDYRTKADLRLPFAGRWFVYWGGRTVADNYHAVDRAQRFAYDFLVMREGRSHDGDGDALADYHCWGRPILAPAAGRVVAAVDRFPDNPPGAMDPANPAGNHVVLDLGAGEYAFLAHLRTGSVAVRQGERVAAGAMIGRCGNSGNSSEPHLHLHLQTTDDLAAGEGLPAVFNDYVADGEAVESGAPIRGETVSPGRATPPDR